MSIEFRIFVGQYQAPTCGEWVDATDAEAVEAAVEKYSEGGRIEVGAMDSENFDGIRTENINTLREIAEYLSEQDDVEARLAYASHVGDYPPGLHREFEDAYCGEWRDESTYAEESYRECYGEPEGPLANYIDWERYARDLFLSDYFSVDSPGGIFVFRHV